MNKIVLGVNELSIQNAISEAERVAAGINEAIENAYQLAEKLIPICERLKELKIISAYTSSIREALKVVCEGSGNELQINKDFINGLKYQR